MQQQPMTRDVCPTVRPIPTEARPLIYDSVADHAEYAISDACDDLAEAVLQLRNVDEALRLRRRVQRIRLLLDHVEQISLMRADALCGQEIRS